MYFKKLFDNDIYVIALAILYIMNIVFVTIGFFTPFWLRGESFGRAQQYIWEYKTTFNLKYLNQMFNLGLTTLCIQYLNFLMTLGALIFKLHENRTFLSFWSITFGTLYPIGVSEFSNDVGCLPFKLRESRIFVSLWSVTFGTLYPSGAILILVGTIMLEVEYNSQVGFSTILGTISGGLMLLFYIGLRFYNDQFVKYTIVLQKQEQPVNLQPTWRKGNTITVN